MDLYAWIRLSPKGEVKLAGQRRRTQQIRFFPSAVFGPQKRVVFIYVPAFLHM